MYYPECIIESNDIKLNDIYISGNKTIIYDYEYIKLNNKIRIKFEKIDEQTADLQVAIESMSKAIQYSDIEIDTMLKVISIVYWELFNQFEKHNNLYKITTDTLIVERTVQLDYNDTELGEIINNTYLKYKSVKRAYDCYPDDLFLFGQMGERVSEIINKLGFANYRKSRGGYLIQFFDIIDSSSNTLIQSFARELSKLGVPCMSIPIFILDSLWQEE